VEVTREWGVGKLIDAKGWKTRKGERKETDTF